MPAGLALLFHFLEQRLLHILRELESALELELGWVGVNRFRLGKIRDRRERLRRLKDLEIEPGLFRFDRRRDAGDAAADDCEIKDSAFILILLPSSFAKSGSARIARTASRAGLGRKLQERNASEIADDAHTRKVGDAELARLRQFLNHAGGPASMQPVGVTLERIKHRKCAQRTLIAEKRRREADLFPFSLPRICFIFLFVTSVIGLPLSKWTTTVSRLMDELRA